MFFAQDVLFKDGPLALIWMAGNDEFKSQALKNRRSKNYVAMLNASIGELSELIRKYFPQMGTAYGLSMKKTAVLVKGLSVIYLSQVQHLSWSMHDTHLRMQSANVRMLRQIDLPLETPARHREPRDVALEPLPPTLGFGDLNETTDLLGDGFGGPRWFANNEDVSGYDQLHQHQIIQTPGPDQQGNRRRKRKRQQGQEEEPEEGLDEDGVLERMRDAVAQNQNAHTIRDAEPIPNPSREGGFGDFGGFDFNITDIGNMQTLQDGARVPEEFEGPEMISAEERLLLSPDRRGGASTRDLDDGQGRHAQRRRRRARVSENDLELEQAGLETIQEEQGAPAMNNTPDRRQEDDLQLESLSQPPRAPQRGRRRRRRPLDIDAEPQIPMDEMRKQLQEQKRPLDYDECRKEMNDERIEAIEKKRKTQHTDFIIGKYNFRRVKEDLYRRTLSSGFGIFIAGAHEVALQERQQQADRPSNFERGDAEVTDEERGIRAEEEIQPGPGSTYERPAVSVSGSSLNIPGAGLSDMDPPPIVPEMENGYQPEFDNPQIFVEPPIPDEDTRGGGPGPGAVIDELGEGRFVFRQLFPPGSISKKKAATAFFQLLRMASEGKVILEQEEPYADIFVTKL